MSRKRIKIHVKRLRNAIRESYRLMQPFRDTRYQAIQEYVGQWYGWWKLGAHLWDRLRNRGEKKLSNKLYIDERPICSYLAAKVNEAQGISFGMEPQAADPDEMLDWVEDHGDVWVRR